MGMALFFTLSGFLIVQFLAAGTPLGIFVMKRLARIVPLSWAAMLALILWHQYDPVTIVRNLLFVSNLPPASLMYGGEHLWSLCVEMQFYLTVAALCLLFGTRGLYFVPVLAIAVTCARIAAGEYVSIVTWHRVDEILAGGTIALIYSGWLGGRAAEVLRRLPVWPFAIAVFVCSHPELRTAAISSPLCGRDFGRGVADRSARLASPHPRFAADGLCRRSFLRPVRDPRSPFAYLAGDRRSDREIPQAPAAVRPDFRVGPRVDPLFRAADNEEGPRFREAQGCGPNDYESFWSRRTISPFRMTISSMFSRKG